MKFLSAAGEACKPKQYVILTVSKLESGTLWEGGRGVLNFYVRRTPMRGHTDGA